MWNVFDIYKTCLSCHLLPQLDCYWADFLTHAQCCIPSTVKFIQTQNQNRFLFWMKFIEKLDSKNKTCFVCVSYFKSALLSYCRHLSGNAHVMWVRPTVLCRQTGRKLKTCSLQLFTVSWNCTRKTEPTSGHFVDEEANLSKAECNVAIILLFYVQ